ncbi:MAG: sigma-70 family RNA polymerase sigma factor [Firmicutes bacterium]|nr:sigma-70 family RNA polymerase sigma factor [Bacillota bacterium]
MPTPTRTAVSPAPATSTRRLLGAIAAPEALQAESLRAYADLIEEVVDRGLRAARTAGWLAAGDPEAGCAVGAILRAAVCQSVAKQLDGATGARSDRSGIAQYCQGLHAGDLALAAACTAEYEPAWSFFVNRYRPALRAAARAMVGADPSAGDELADSLWAELYGVRDSASDRRPLLGYYHGRSRLLTWLRAVLAQRYVDGWRAARRTQPFEPGEATPPASSCASAVAVGGEPPEPDRAALVAQFERAFRAALAGLTQRDRLCLAYYYLQGLTLAEIGRLLAEHEATVSRRLERVRRQIREAVENSLSQEFAARSGAAPFGWLRRKRLCEQRIRICLEYTLQDASFDLAALLAAPEAEAGPASPVPEPRRKRFAPLRSMLRSRT